MKNKRKHHQDIKYSKIKNNSLNVQNYVHQSRKDSDRHKNGKGNLWRYNFLDQHKTIIRYDKPLKLINDNEFGGISVENPHFGQEIPKTNPNQTGATFYSSGAKYTNNGNAKENFSPVPFDVSTMNIKDSSPQFYPQSNNQYNFEKNISESNDLNDRVTPNNSIMDIDDDFCTPSVLKRKYPVFVSVSYKSDPSNIAKEACRRGKCKRYRNGWLWYKLQQS